MGVSCKPFLCFFNFRNWIVLFVLVASLWGGYASYDAPGALAVWLEEDLGIYPTKLGLLYSAYSAPIILIALFCGNLADKYGVNIFMALYQVMACLGAALFALAYSKTEQVAFVMMLISRIISGIGNDGLAIVTRKAVFSWFDESNQSLAITLIMTCPFLGTQFAFIFLPIIASNIGGGAAAWVVFLFCVVGLFFSVIYFFISRFCPSEWEESSLVDDSIEKPNWIVELWQTATALPWRFWVIALSDMFIQGALWPFVAFSPDFFYHHYNFSPQLAGIFATILAGMAIPLGIVVGYAGKKIPKPILGMNAGLFQLVCFLVLGWATEFPCILATLGLSLVLGSMGTAIYAPVSQMVPYENLGTAVGILRSCESISWLISPPLYGMIYEHTHNFAWSCTLFAGMGLVAIPLQLILLLTEKSAPQKLAVDTLQEPQFV